MAGEKITLADIQIVLSANTQAINAIPAVLSGLDKSIKSLNTTVKLLATTMESSFAKSQSAASKSISTTNKSISSQQKLLNKTKTLLISAKTKQLDLNAAIRKAGNATGQLGQRLGNTTNAYKALSNTIKNGIKDTTQLTQANTQFTSSMSTVKRSLAEQATAQRRVGAATKSSVVSIEQLERKLSQASIRVKDLTQSLGNTKKGKEAVKELEKAFRDFEKVLKRSNVTSEQASRAQNKLSEALSKTKRATRAGRSGITELSKSIQIALGPLSGVASRLTAFAALTGTVAAGVATLITGFIALGVFLAKAIVAGKEFEKEFLRINAILVATGKNAVITAGSINRIAQEIGEETLTNASKARQALAALLTLENIPIEEKFIKKIGLAAQGLSLLGRGDIISNMRKLKRILEEPAQSLKSLSDAGIFFSTIQQRMIIDAVEQGNKTAALTVIMDNLNPAIAAATKETGGLAGAIDSLNEAWTKFLETAGFGTGLVGLVAEGVEFLIKVVDSFNKNLNSTIILFRNIGDIASNIRDFAFGKFVIDTDVKFIGDFTGFDKIIARRAKLTKDASKEIQGLVKAFLPFIRENKKATNATINFGTQIKKLSESQLVDLLAIVGLTKKELLVLADVLDRRLSTAAGRAIQSIKNNIQASKQEIAIISLRGSARARLTDRLKAAQDVQASFKDLNLEEAFSLKKLSGQRKKDAEAIQEQSLSLSKFKRIQNILGQTDVLADRIQLLKAESKIIGINAISETKLLAVFAAKQKLLKSNLDLTSLAARNFLKFVREAEDVVAKIDFKRSIKGLTDQISLQKTEMGLLLLTSELRERQLAIAVKQQEVLNKFGLRKEGVVELELFIKTLDNKKIIDDFTKAVVAIEDAFDGVAISLNNLLVDGLKEGETFAERFRDIFVTALKDIQKELFKTFVLQPLKNSLSQSLSNAFGPAFGVKIAGQKPVLVLGTLTNPMIVRQHPSQNFGLGGGGVGSSTNLFPSGFGGGGTSVVDSKEILKQVIPKISDKAIMSRIPAIQSLIPDKTIQSLIPKSTVQSEISNKAIQSLIPSKAIMSKIPESTIASARLITTVQEATTDNIVKATKAVSSSVDDLPSSLGTLFSSPQGPFPDFAKGGGTPGFPGSGDEMFKFFEDFGFSDKNIAGFMGNAAVEAPGFNASAKNAAEQGVGLFQVSKRESPDRFALLESFGDVEKASNQLKAAAVELKTTEGAALRLFQANRDSVRGSTAAGIRFERPAGTQISKGADALFGAESGGRRLTEANKAFTRIQDFRAGGSGGAVAGGLDFSRGSGLDLTELQGSFDQLTESMTDAPDIFSSLSGSIPNATNGLTAMTDGLVNSVSATELATLATQTGTVAKGTETAASGTAAVAKGSEALSGQAAAVGLQAVATAAPSAAVGLSTASLGGIGGGGGFGGGGGLFSVLSSIGFHKGGVVGREGKSLVSLPRFHEGLAPDEFRAVLRRNEAVFTPEQLKVLGIAMSSGGRDNSSRGGPPTIINNFTTPDPDSFRRTEAQVGRKMAREIELSSRAS